VIEKFNPADMKRIFLFLIPFVVACTAQPKQKVDAKAEILSIMQNQAEDWSRGDLDAFMLPYWNSDSLMFIGSRGVSYGWQKVLDNYREVYGGPEEMGQLVFDIKTVETLSENHAWVVGHWQLNRETDTLKGMYTLLWQYIEGEWKIVADHSS
jgi:hypothetical protein